MRFQPSVRVGLALATALVGFAPTGTYARQVSPDGKDTGSISGRVLSGGIPCELTEVELTRESGPRFRRVEVAGGNGTGAFEFSGLSHGRYLLKVAALTEGRGKRRKPALASRRVVLTEGQAVSGIVLELTGAVAASGRVVIAETREPVRAFVFLNPLGRPGPSFTGVSNDDGTFRIEGLVPGEWTGFAGLVDAGGYYG